MTHDNKISITPLLKRLVDPETLRSVSAEEIAAALELIFDNDLAPEQCASLLTVLSSSGRAWEPELVARCAAITRARGVPLHDEGRTLHDAVVRRRQGQVPKMAAAADLETRDDPAAATAAATVRYNGGLCDIVGTGGDGHSTFNTSTAASIVASALLCVLKHGNVASSSLSGSADMLRAAADPQSRTNPGRTPVLEAITADSLPQALERSSYAFAYAPVFNRSLVNVAAIRRSLGFKTVFNILGPLTSPVESLIEARVCGVFTRRLGPSYAEALRLMGARKAMVVCGAEEMDEISCAGKTFCWRLVESGGSAASPLPGVHRHHPSVPVPVPVPTRQNGDSANPSSSSKSKKIAIEQFELCPADFGLPAHPLSEVSGGRSAQENAAILIRMLRNELPPDDPTLHFVLINAAALFVIAGVCDSDRSHMGPGDSGKVVLERGPGGGRWKEGVRRARWAIESGKALEAFENYRDFTLLD